MPDQVRHDNDVAPVVRWQILVQAKAAKTKSLHCPSNNLKKRQIRFEGKAQADAKAQHTNRM